MTDLELEALNARRKLFGRKPISRAMIEHLKRGAGRDAEPYQLLEYLVGWEPAKGDVPGEDFSG